MTITHSFVSAKSDGGDATLVKPSDWNAGHVGEHSEVHAIDGAAHTGDIETAQIANDAVTYPKMQNVSAASRLLGRGSAGGAGDPEELTLGTGLSMAGAVVSAHAQSHALDGADHTVAGLTDGMFLRATGAGTFAFEQYVTEYTVGAGQFQWTNLGAGPTDMSVPSRAVCDLSKVTQVRMVCIVIGAGVTGDAKLQYSTDDATWSDLTTNLIDLSSTGVKGSTWENIPGGAQADLIAVRCVAVNGNTTEDPSVKAVALQVR